MHGENEEGRGMHGKNEEGRGMHGKNEEGRERVQLRTGKKGIGRTLEEKYTGRGSQGGMASSRLEKLSCRLS